MLEIKFGLRSDLTSYLQSFQMQNLSIFSQISTLHFDICSFLLSFSYFSTILKDSISSSISSNLVSVAVMKQQTEAIKANYLIFSKLSKVNFLHPKLKFNFLSLKLIRVPILNVHAGVTPFWSPNKLLFSSLGLKHNFFLIIFSLAQLLFFQQ